MIDKKDLFEYEGFHFAPVQTVDKTMPYQYFAERIYSDRKFGMAAYEFEWVKHPWDYEKFYKSATKPADIFVCVENGCFYLPAGNELFGWRNEPSEIKVNRYILDVILAVLSYCQFQRNHKMLIGDIQYDVFSKTKEYYYSLDLPFGMKKNNHDFEKVLSYERNTGLLEEMKNTEYLNLYKFCF